MAKLLKFLEFRAIEKYEEDRKVFDIDSKWSVNRDRANDMQS